MALIAYLIFVNIGGLIHIWPMNATHTAPKNINFLLGRLSFPMSYPGMSGISGLDDMNHVETFVRSNLSETSIAPGKFNYKNPFWVSSSEIQTLLSRNTEFRTGGFGPLYALHLMLAGLVFVGILFSREAPTTVAPSMDMALFHPIRFGVAHFLGEVDSSLWSHGGFLFDGVTRNESKFIFGI